MNKYKFKATNLIAETFEYHDVKFSIASNHENEQIIAGFPIDCGPNAIVQFISCDNGNDVAVRIFNLISNIPDEKKIRVMEACNTLNNKIRYTKFYLDSDGDVNVEYDFPISCPDNGLGEMAFEIFIRLIKILDSEYSIFMKALYSDEKLGIQRESVPDELIQKLESFRKMMADREDFVNDEDIDDVDEDVN